MRGLGHGPEIVSGCDELFDVLGEHVDLQIDLVARFERAERGHFERVRDQRDLEGAVAQGRDRERDTVDGDRPFLHAVAENLGPRFDPDAAAVVDRRDTAEPVHVALDEVPAEWVADARRGLEVDVVLCAEPRRASSG